MKTVVLLPTYNEAGNIEPMLKAIGLNLPSADMLVIDDNSPDGTGAIADRYAEKNPHVHVAHRPGKQGLGVAYRYGYKWALDGGYDRVLQIDCDFSHNPSDLPRMHAHLDTFSAVIGSRRVKNGGVAGWGPHRHLISGLGSLYARTVLFNCPVRDLTAGFKGFRREALQALDLPSLRVDGYGFQIEVTANLVARGIAVYEMPIQFTDRTVGESKMSTRIFVEALIKVWQIRSEIAAGR